MFCAFTVGLFVRGKDEKIVHVNDKPSFCDHVLEGIVHELLECRRGVGKPKKHYCWLKKAFMHNEGSFPLVTIFDANIVITPMDVKLGE